MAPTPNVAAFNALPRPSTTRPSQTAPTTTTSPPNHWHISIHNIPLSPPGDLLFLIQPSTGYIHVEGPLPLLSLPSPAAQAATIVPLLIKAFSEGLSGYSLGKTEGGKGAGENIREERVFAPSSLSTTDKKLAESLGKELKKIGVRKECRVVGVGAPGEEKSVAAQWDKFAEGLTSVTKG